MPQHIHTTLTRAAAVLAILLGIAGCGPAPAPNEITIASTGMIFSVTEARGKAGQEVVLRLVNRDSYAHAFDIDEFNVHLTLEGKATQTVRITPAKPGRFAYYCGSPGHRAAGMEGALIVDP
jgi:plastocyanin